MLKIQYFLQQVTSNCQYLNKLYFFFHYLNNIDYLYNIIKQYRNYCSNLSFIFLCFEIYLHLICFKCTINKYFQLKIMEHIKYNKTKF